MSCSLFWRPRSKGGRIGDHQLRDALREEFGDWPIRLDLNDAPFLRGLAAAKVDGARELIENLEKHEEVELYVEC